MRQLDHPNIVKLVDFSESRQYYYIILELAPGGELFHQIVRLTYFSEDLSRHVITQVGEALEYLHEEKGVVHRYAQQYVVGFVVLLTSSGISNQKIYCSRRFLSFRPNIQSPSRQKMRTKLTKESLSKALALVVLEKSRLPTSVCQRLCGTVKL